jgi:methionyl-tRNA formyltransferase
LKVAAIGRHELLYNSILKVKEAGHDIVLIITWKESPGYSRDALDFRTLSERMAVSFLQTEQINSQEVMQTIEKSEAEIGISVNWRTLIGQQVIDCFPRGIIGAHAGDLPRYRGNAAPNWAIIRGESKIILTLYMITRELDAGPIVLQREMPISQRTYISEVYGFLLANCPDMFLEAIDGIASGLIKPRQQSKDPASSLRCYPRIPRDGEIDWNLPAIELDRLVRATSEPFEGAYTFIGTEKLVIWKAHFETPSYHYVGSPGQVAERRLKAGEVVVVTGRDFLVLEEVESRRKGRRKATEIIASARTRLGMDVTAEIVKMREDLEEVKRMTSFGHSQC